MIEGRPELQPASRPDLDSAAALEELLSAVRRLEAEWRLDDRIRWQVEHERLEWAR